MLAINAQPVSPLGEELTQAALQCFEAGIFLLDERGAIVQTNRAAERVLAESDGWALQPGRAPRPTRLAELQQFQQLIRQGLGGVSFMNVTRRSGKPAYAVLVRRAPGAGAVVIVVDPVLAAARDRAGIGEVLQRLHGLTAAQARLVAALASGADLQQAAEGLGITVNTARTQLKQARAKTGLHSQMELVRLAARYAVFDLETNGGQAK